MMRILAASIAFISAGLPLQAYEHPPVEPGFVRLFDGKDLEKHFVILGRKESWQVRDGILRALPGGDRILTRRKYRDFVLRLEWRVTEGGNSGVFIRVPRHEDRNPWVTGFEVQISNAPRDEAHCTASLYGVVPVRERPDERAGVWHTFEIIALGGRITVWADGKRTVDARAEDHPAMRKRPLEGYVGLQDYHARNGYVEYRNIRIQELQPDGTPAGFQSLTKDSSAWEKIRSGHGTGGLWVFRDGVWEGEQDPPGSGNGGILATKERFGDFELVIETKPDWGVCSGVFLRSDDRGRAYQIMVDFHGGGNVGGLYGEGIGGFNIRNYRFLEDGGIEALEPRAGVRGAVALPFGPGDWSRVWRRDDFNEIRARIRGNPPAVDVWLNGIYITHFEDSERRLADEGRIGIQVHGGKGWPKGAKVRYRNAAVRPLRAGG